MTAIASMQAVTGASVTVACSARSRRKAAAAATDVVSSNSAAAVEGQDGEAGETSEVGERRADGGPARALETAGESAGAEHGDQRDADQHRAGEQERAADP